jgi:hypothetical protein
VCLANLCFNVKFEELSINVLITLRTCYCGNEMKVISHRRIFKGTGTASGFEFINLTLKTEHTLLQHIAPEDMFLIAAATTNLWPQRWHYDINEILVYIIY